MSEYFQFTVSAANNTPQETIYLYIGQFAGGYSFPPNIGAIPSNTWISINSY